MIRLFFLIIFLKMRNLSNFQIPNRIYIILGIYILFSFISGMINGVGLFTTLGYLAVYLRYPLLFVLLANIDVSEKAIRKFFIMFLVLFFIQIPEVLIRYTTLNIKGDDISWSLGSWGTTNLGIYGIYSGCLIVAHALNNRFTIFHIAGLFLLFIPAIFGEIKAVIIWLPIIIILTIFMHPFRTRIKKYTTLFAMLTIVIVGSSIVMNFWQSFYGNQLSNIINNIHKTIQGNVGWEDKYSAYRLGIFLRIIESARLNQTNFLLGYGPGSSFVGNFSGKPGLITTFENPSKDTPNQIASTILDVGIIGLILYYLILFNLVFIWKKANNIINGNENKFLGIMRTAFGGMLFYYLIVGPLYHPVWRFDAASFILYFFASELWRGTQAKE